MTSNPATGSNLLPPISNRGQSNRGQIQQPSSFINQLDSEPAADMSNHALINNEERDLENFILSSSSQHSRKRKTAKQMVG